MLQGPLAARAATCQSSHNKGHVTPIQWTQLSNAATFSYRVLEALEAPTTALRWKLQANVDTPTIGIGFDLHTAPNEEKLLVLKGLGLAVDVKTGEAPLAGTPQATEIRNCYWHLRNLRGARWGEASARKQYRLVAAHKNACS